jgi:hypothetical protein
MSKDQSPSENSEICMSIFLQPTIHIQIMTRRITYKMVYMILGFVYPQRRRMKSSSLILKIFRFHLHIYSQHLNQRKVMGKFLLPQLCIFTRIRGRIHLGINKKERLRVLYGISKLLESICVSCWVKVLYMPFAC